MDWLGLAKNLPEGTSKRFVHECGSGKACIITHNKEYYSFYCFRCGERHYQKKEFSLPEWVRKEQVKQEIAATKRAKHDKGFKSIEDLDYLKLTAEFAKFDINALTWLFKAGITEDLAKKYKIMYSEAMHRVFLPVFNLAGDLVYYQLRGFDPKKPKYINPAKNGKIHFYAGEVTEYPLVLCEDILSAIKIGQVTRACALLGTDMSPRLLTNLMIDGRALVWLDPDEAGQHKARKHYQTCLALGIRAKNIISLRDPKLYCVDDIKQLLSDSL